MLDDDEEELSQEIIAKLEALPAPTVPSGRQLSPFIQKFRLLPQMDPRRLETEEVGLSKHNVTHVCSFCNKCIFIFWRKAKKTETTKNSLDGRGSYDTTKPRRHLEKVCEGGGKVCPEIIQWQLNQNQTKKRKSMEQTSKAQKKTKTAQGNIRSIFDTQSYHNRALCAQSHFFLYSKSSIPIAMFEDPLFKNMLEAMIPPSCIIDKPPILNRFGAANYAASEFNLFKTCIHNELKPMLEESKGNTFCQLIHDGVTLSNKSKYQAFGIQFTNRKFRCNHVVALGFRKVANSTTVTVAELGRELVKDRTQFELQEIIACSVQDGAAKGETKAWDLEVETCDMHDGDKIGASAIGRLVRKDGRGNVVNPFPAGQELEKKLNAQAKHFASTHANRVRYACIIANANLDYPLPTTMIKQDLCGTPMSSFHQLVRSTLKIKKSLDLYFLTRRRERGSTINDFLSQDDWKLAVEVEATLNIAKDVVTISQTESKLNAAYGPVVRNATYKKLTSDKIMVIDITNWDNSMARAPRKEVEVDTFSEAGRECRARATLECERRFFGNNGNETMDAEGAQAKMKLSQREMATLVLDKRTCMQKSVMGSKEEWVEAANVLETYYVDFYKRRKLYDREKSRENRDIKDNLQEPVGEGQSSAKTFRFEDDDSDSGSIGDEDEISIPNEREDAARLAQIDALNAQQEFKKVIKKWRNWTPNWKDLYPKKEFTHSKDANGEDFCDPDPFEELIDIDMAILMKRIEEYNSDNNAIFGYLPMMCRLSPCQLGALNAQSFVERMNSAAKLIVGEKRTSLNHELIDKLVVLRLNRDFMVYCRQHGSMARVREVDNTEGNDVDIYNST